MTDTSDRNSDDFGDQPNKLFGSEGPDREVAASSDPSLIETNTSSGDDPGMADSSVAAGGVKNKSDQHTVGEAIGGAAVGLFLAAIPLGFLYLIFVAGFGARQPFFVAAVVWLVICLITSVMLTLLGASSGADRAGYGLLTVVLIGALAGAISITNSNADMARKHAAATATAITATSIVRSTQVAETHAMATSTAVEIAAHAKATSTAARNCLKRS